MKRVVLRGGRKKNGGDNIYICKIRKKEEKKMSRLNVSVFQQARLLEFFQFFN